MPPAPPARTRRREWRTVVTGALTAAAACGSPAPSAPAGAAPAAGFGGNVPGERASVLDTDALVWVGPPTLRAQPAADPVHRRLDVATQGRAGRAFSFVTPLSIPHLLDGLMPQLAAIDGDANTAFG